MLPIALDLKQLAIALIGEGDKLARRKEQLESLGATHIEVFAKAEHVTQEQLKPFRLVLGVELDKTHAARIAKEARELGILVDMEDQPEAYDFYYASYVKRGDLMLSVHSMGKSPKLTQRIRDALGILFPTERESHLEDIALKRKTWIKQGLSMQKIKTKSDQYIDQEGWLAWIKH